ncbi:nucleotidyltransferase family protein [Shewanella colwelliana]|uniref:nucleotidyltransferase family protein n=1 Tax=Shewanella colwelliana TaxID=23 RepID=UPI0022AF8F7E|nr:nucleotidyltransferase family protein [Shewanella colwelliana]MCZ4338869.1 nucleotidyltransferase family protein [Shewanella colwelliana]
MNHQNISNSQQLCLWLKQDAMRMDALKYAAQLNLPQWCIAAGFVRNLVWDRLHGRLNTPLTDIDVIYFDPSDLSIDSEYGYHAKLQALAPDYPWSVKNQARMHIRNGDEPYTSTLDAMAYWPELETAVGVNLSLAEVAEPLMPHSPLISNLDALQGIEIFAPFGLASLFDLRVSPNPKRDIKVFHQRVKQKNWLGQYPKLSCTTE